MRIAASLGLVWCLVVGGSPTALRGGSFAPTGNAGYAPVPDDSPQIVEWASAVTAVNRGLVRIDNPSLGTVHFGGSSGTPASMAPLGPVGNDTLNTPFALGQGGNMTLSFPRPIRDAAGPDFAVFNNGFSTGLNQEWIKPAFVAVSSDGVNFVRFPAVSQTPTAPQIASFTPLDPTNLSNLAGKDPAGLGTPFDLTELAGAPGLDIQAVRYVQLIDCVGDIDPVYATYDSRGNIVNAPWPAFSAVGSEGFNLAGVGVMNAVPEPEAFSLIAAAAALGVIVVRGRRTSVRLFLIVAAISVLAFRRPAHADTLWPSYSDQSVNIHPEGQFTANGGNLYSWTHSQGYQIYNTATLSTTTIGLPPNGTVSNGLGDAFGVYDPTNKAFYAGTTAGNFMNPVADIYQYNGSAGTWSNSTSAGVSLNGANGAQTHSGQLYVSQGVGATANLVVYGQNGIANNSAPQTLGQVAGYPSYLAVAPNGDLYYAPSTYYVDFTTERDTLYRWTAAQVLAAAVTPLSVSNAAQTVILPGSGSGLAVDTAGNVFFAVNDSVTGISTLGMLDSLASNGVFDTIYTSDGFGDFFGAISIDGNFKNGGTLYFNPGIGYANSVMAIRAAPEPGALALLATAATISLIAWRRRRASNRLAP